MEVLHASARAIAENSMLAIVLLCVLLGGAGERISYLLEQRRKTAKLKAELRATKSENARLVELLRGATDVHGLIGNAQGGDMAQLAAQASQALNERTELLTLLHQVQAADQAWPQLPREVRDEIDAAVDRYRPRRPTST